MEDSGSGSGSNGSQVQEVTAERTNLTDVLLRRAVSVSLSFLLWAER